MKGRRPASGSEDAQRRRAPQAVTRKRRAAAHFPASEPIAAPSQPSPVPPAAFGMSGSAETAANIAARVSRRTAALDQPGQPLPLVSPDVLDTAAPTDNGSPSGRIIAGESPFTVTTLLSRIETDYSHLLFLAISLERLAREEIARLSGERPNDPQTVENNKKHCDLLSILADGFARLSAALVEYSESPQPLLRGKAKQIADEVGARLKAWWNANASEATDWCIRLPMLTASIGALGVVGADMSFATPLVGVLVGGQKAATVIKAVTKRRKKS